MISTRGPGGSRLFNNQATANHQDFPGRPLVFLSKKDLTVATVLKKAGYVTGGFGKWGLHRSFAGHSQNQERVRRLRSIELLKMVLLK